MPSQPKLETVSRRAALSSFGTIGGMLLLLNQAVAQENNPAAQVADSASTIKINGLKTHRVAHKVYIELLTNLGVTGLGEISALEPTAAEALMKSLFELLEGENPTRIEHLWQKVFRAHRDMRGGPCRDKVRVYPTSKAHKVPPHGIYGHGGHPHEIDRMVNAIKATGERVGPDGTVMFDAHCAVPPDTLIQFAAAFRK